MFIYNKRKGLVTQASVAFDWATENVPNRQPTACSTSSPPGFCFLGRQLPKLKLAPFDTGCPTSSQLIANPVAHRFTTLAVYAGARQV